MKIFKKYLIFIIILMNLSEVIAKPFFSCLTTDHKYSLRIYSGLNEEAPEELKDNEYSVHFYSVNVLGSRGVDLLPPPQGSQINLIQLLKNETSATFINKDIRIDTSGLAMSVGIWTIKFQDKSYTCKQN